MYIHNNYYQRLQGFKDKMISRTGLLKEFLLISKTKWKRIGGIPYNWTGVRLEVNRKFFLKSAILMGICGLCHLICGLHQLSMSGKSKLGNSKVTQDKQSILVPPVAGVILVLAKFCWTIHEKPELMEGNLKTRILIDLPTTMSKL